MKYAAVLCLTILSFGCGGYGSPKTAAPQPGVVPVIMELSPDNTNAGGPDFVLTVNGSRFATNAVVNWNNKRQPTTYVSGSQVMAKIPAAAIATAGAASISVTNPGTAGSGGIYGGGGTRDETSNTVTFTIN